MQMLIVSERPASTQPLRFALASLVRELAVECIALADGPGLPVRADASPDAVFVVLPDDAASAGEVLRRWRGVCSARLVAVGTADSPQQILDAIRAGADDFVDERQDLLPQLTAVVQRIPAATRARSGQGGLVTVCAAAGGGGGTLVAANLAVLWAGEAAACGLIDLGHHSGDLAALLSLAPRHTLGDLCASHESLDRDMLLKSCTAHTSGVQLIASAPATEELAHDTGAPLERMLTIARQVLPTVVVDLHPRRPCAARVLALSDLVVLLLPLTFTAVCNARRRLDEWRDSGIDPSRVVIVANRCGQPGEIPADRVTPLLGGAVAAALACDDVAANLSVNCGAPVVAESPHSPLTRDLTRLADRLMERLSPGGRQTPRHDSAARPPSSSAGEFLRRAASILFC